jgi:hypothetical protein
LWWSSRRSIWSISMTSSLRARRSWQPCCSRRTCKGSALNDYAGSCWVTSQVRACSRSRRKPAICFCNLVSNRNPRTSAEALLHFGRRKSFSMAFTWLVPRWPVRTDHRRFPIMLIRNWTGRLCGSCKNSTVGLACSTFQSRVPITRLC